MFRETLKYEMCDHFYQLRDSLAIAAHVWLGRPNDLFEDENGEWFDEGELHETLMQIWEDPSIIDRYERENPHGMSQDDLEIVGSWKSGVDGYFTVFEHAGTLLFLEGGRLFHVTGLLEPVRDVIAADELPCIVKAHLLPYGNYVVYDGYFMVLPVALGPGARRSVDDGIAKALADGEHVSSGTRLIELAPIIADERIHEEADRMIHELELDMKASQPLEGHHVGALAGLSGDERSKVAREHLGNPFEDDEGYEFSDLLMEDAVKGPPRRDLAGLMMTEKKDKLRLWSRIFGLPSGTSQTKVRMVEALASLLAGSEFLPAVALEHQTPASFKGFRRVYEAGGELRIPYGEVRSLDDLPEPFPPVCYLFYSEGEFVFVIPDEIMGVLDELEWDKYYQVSCDFYNSVQIANALVNLRGIVTMREAYDEFRRCYPDGFGIVDFTEGIESAAREGRTHFDILWVNDGEDEVTTHNGVPEFTGTDYLVHYVLGEQWREDNGIEFEEGEYADPFLEGELGGLEAIVQSQSGKQPRTLGDMRNNLDVWKWKLGLPAVRAMRDYLDEHVPDDADDYTFADDTVADLVEVMTAGFISAEIAHLYTDILEEHGMKLNEAHLSRVLDLLMNMANSIPTWMNNGWAPNELHEARTGQKVFYNPDGSPMKVGRNDPCPCGSGKKYKKCCGR